MLPFFVDGWFGNTQLSKLFSVQSVPGSQAMGDTTALSSKTPKVLRFLHNFYASLSRFCHKKTFHRTVCSHSTGRTLSAWLNVSDFMLFAPYLHASSACSLPILTALLKWARPINSCQPISNHYYASLVFFNQSGCSYGRQTGGVSSGLTGGPFHSKYSLKQCYFVDMVKSSPSARHTSEHL